MGYASNITGKQVSELVLSNPVSEDRFISELDKKIGINQVYTNQEIDAKIEEARISINITDEQLSKLNVNLTPITTELSELNLFPIKGKKLLVLGDSLSSSGGGSMESPAIGSWCQYVKNLLKLSADSRVIANGGATCTDKNNTTLKPSKADWGGDDNVLSNQVYSVINHYKTNKGTASEFTPDVIMLMVGTNNAHTSYPDPMWNTVIGDWASCMYSQFTDTDFDLYDLSDNAQLQKYNTLRDIRKKFYSAYKWAIEALLYWFPNASIYILSPMANSGGRGKNIFENVLPACKKIADFLSCGWVDVYSRSGCSYYSNNTKNSGWNDYWYTFDGTHPNFNPGMELIGRYVAKELQSQYFVKPPIVAVKVPMSGGDVFYTVNIVNANADTSFGTTDPVGSQSVIKGGSLTVNIIPAAEHYIYSVKANGVEQGAITTYTFTNIQADQEIIVEFAKSEVPPMEEYTVTASSNNTNYGTVAPVTQKVQKGGTVTITATAKSGYEIESWSGATGTGIGTTSGTATLTNVQSDKAITCSFKLTPPKPTGKTILSFPWTYGDHQQIVDGVTKIWVSGSSVNTTTPVGTLTMNGKGGTNYNNTIGKTTGDNSGIYSDIFLERGLQFSSGTEAANNMNVTISGMENGTYTIKTLHNISSTSNWAQYAATPDAVELDVNGVVKNPAKTVDNTDTLTVFENVVVSDGILTIKGAITGISKRFMLNILEIQKM